MRSDEKLDQTLMRGGLHNMKFLPSVLSGRKGAESLINMLATHFETQRAFQLQFNIVDNKMLRDAQVHPEKYRDLIVRFAGFSTLFVEMGKAAQDQVIERTAEQV
jgi:pyruvate-formate lyase